LGVDGTYSLLRDANSIETIVVLVANAGETVPLTIRLTFDADIVLHVVIFVAETG
jgi:hypothetical protein